MSEQQADLNDAIHHYLASENPEETADSILTSWAVVGYYEPLNPDSESIGYIAVSGNGSPITNIGLLRCGERYLLDE